MAHLIKIGNGNETKYKSRPDINARSEEVKVRPDWNKQIRMLLTMLKIERMDMNALKI